MKYLPLPLIVLLCLSAVSAQDALGLAVQGRGRDVFMRPHSDNSAETEIVFVDLLTGETTSVVTTGERYTLLQDAVLYFDLSDRQVKRISPDGEIRNHSFIKMTSADYRLDWTISDDRQLIAWALSQRSADQKLTTTIRLADPAGSQIRQLIAYGPRAGIRLLPVAFGADGNRLYIDVHADGADSLSPYPRRSNLFMLDFGGAGVATRQLPGESACFCAVGFGNGVMLRLAPSGEPDSTQVEIYDIDTGAARVIAPVSRGDYDKSGNVLVSPDDSFAVYALTRTSSLRASAEEARTVLVLADIENARQSVIGSPMHKFARPIMWTEDNSAVLFTQAGSPATWKFQLEEGRAKKVASATYLGRLSESASN